MVTVRGKQRRKKANTINKTAYGKQRKKHANKKRATISDDIVRTHWDKKLTIKENFANLGLVSDPNHSIRKTHHKKEEVDNEEEFGDIAEYETTEVVKALEAKSKTYVPTTRHYSPVECALWDYFITAHGADYKLMCRDKKNTYQHTPKQIKRKIEDYLKFKQSDHVTRMGCVG